VNRRAFCLSLAASSLGGASISVRALAAEAPRDGRLLTTLAIGGALKVRGYAGVNLLRSGPLVVPEAGRTLALPGYNDENLDSVLRCFFATAILSVGHALSQRPVIGLYSPTLDFWWIAQVQRREAPVVLRAAFLPGGTLAGRKPGAAARLIAETANLNLFEALRSSARAAADEFEAQFPRDGLGEPAALTSFLTRAAPELLSARLARQVSALADFGGTATLYQPLRAVLVALGQPAPVPPPDLSLPMRNRFLQIARADIPFRKALIPVGIFSAEDRFFVISGNAATGRVLLVSAHRPGAPSTLEQLALIDTRPE